MDQDFQEVLVLNDPAQLKTYVLDVNQPTFDIVWMLWFRIIYRLQPPVGQLGWTAVEAKCVQYNPFKESA